MSLFLHKRISSSAFLSPMAGYTNLPFRILCQRYSTSVTITEFISALSLKAKPSLVPKRSEEEKLSGIQLFGGEPGHFTQILDLIEKQFDFIDANFGCPDRKLIEQKSGAYLLNHPDKMFEIVKALKDCSSKPITCKIRLGVNKDDSIKIIEKLSKAEPDAIFVHGRTVKQHYSGKADWGAIKKLVESFPNLEIVGNGDIRSKQDFDEKLSFSGCKFALIGRAAIKNPLIFKEIATGKSFQLSDKLKLLREYFDICKDLDELELNDLRLKAVGVVSGVQNASRLRDKLARAKSIGELTSILNFD